ncbi:dihydrolipoyl dehydrogenase [Candidatus Schneideria nysicola]|uniref:dihydrolipoyl dehydrogenase n=1 Tax=Candidatus Schneideria nysicola TaxID=1081631 RepID=UPI001CAA420E|nr:dihydrolipoyl dehydrogenase [Candidatus Schneideria nysicola]UAJ65348.1 dihydrolipoyl dehydrogenase [Candidatus Schneideria nysicola]
MKVNEVRTQVVIIGAGPGGYAAALRCMDLGLNGILVESSTVLGGVCLNQGCIPSKALLHVAKVIRESLSFIDKGIIFNKPSIDIKKIRNWKDKIICTLNTNLINMAQLRKLKLIYGHGRFIKPNLLEVKENDHTTTHIIFEHAIIATGSRPIILPLIPYEDSRIWSSSDALNIPHIPKRLLIIGGGVIGLEMATIYSALGSIVDIIESYENILPMVDKEITKFFIKNIKNKFNLMLETVFVKIIPQKEGIYVEMKQKMKTFNQIYDNILVTVGRRPNSDTLSLQLVDIEVDKKEFIKVDKQMRTNIPNIYAIGDIISQPMLAHKSTHQGHIAAEVISGKNHFFNPKVIPSIVYTDPEIAWIGISEKEAKKIGIEYEIVTFPWLASGKAITSCTQNGMTRLIFNKKNNRIIGGSVVGHNGGELLGEIGIAIEMGANAEDIALTIHAHPTLYESIGLAAEIYMGTITDLPNFKSKK